MNKSPFSDEVTGLNDAQVDWILEMYYAEHPEEGRFQRGVDVAQSMAANSAKIQWLDVLKHSKSRDKIIYGDYPKPVIPKHLLKVR